MFGIITELGSLLVKQGKARGNIVECVYKFSMSLQRRCRFLRSSQSCEAKEVGVLVFTIWIECRVKLQGKGRQIKERKIVSKKHPHFHSKLRAFTRYVMF